MTILSSSFVGAHCVEAPHRGVDDYREVKPVDRLLSMFRSRFEGDIFDLTSVEDTQSVAQNKLL